MTQSTQRTGLKVLQKHLFFSEENSRILRFKPRCRASSTLPQEPAERKNCSGTQEMPYHQCRFADILRGAAVNSGTLSIFNLWAASQFEYPSSQRSILGLTHAII